MIQITGWCKSTGWCKATGWYKLPGDNDPGSIRCIGCCHSDKAACLL